MNRKKICFPAIASVAFLLLFAACRKEQKFSEIPYIEFVSLTKADPSTGMDVLLTFNFQDGDGDIGLDDYDIEPPYDTSSIFHYNCFIDYYEKQNGEFVKVDLPATMNVRIPRLSYKEVESIEGTLYISLYANNPFSPYDTIKYTVTIVDRALNYSNTISTSEYIVNK